MNIFDPHITGSLSVSGSGEISNNLLISGNLTVLGAITGSISGSITNADNAETASYAPKYTLTSSFNTFTSSYNTGSFSGSFIGNGSNLYDIPASGVTGLNLNKIISGSVSASISPDRGFEVNTDVTFTGSVNITGSISLNGQAIGTGKLDETTFESYTSSIATYTGETESIIATLSTTSSVNTLSSSIATTDLNQNNRLDDIETSTSSLNAYTTSLNDAIQVTGSNLTIKGDLLVKGTTTQIDSTTLAIGDNIIQLNGTGATNAGLVVRDATVPGIVSGSLLWDTSNDKWIAGPLGSEDDVVLRTTSQTLTNKTISGASNTLSDIANASLTNSSITIGSTSTSLGSTSTSLAGLTSVTSTAFTGSLQGSISGNAATVTNGVYTNTNQTITGQKTFQEQSDDVAVILDSTSAAHATRFRYRKNGVDYWSLDARGSGESDSFQLYRYYGGNWYSAVSFNHSNSAVTFSGAITGSNLSGTNTGDETLARINALAITTVGTITSGTWNGTTIAIANGGTGGTTASAARTNLGLAIGTDVLAYRTFGTAAANNTGDFALFNATHYVGTTAITANRASGAQTLTGVSIDGNATSETLSTVTTRGASSSASITLSNATPFIFTGFGSGTYTQSTIYVNTNGLTFEGHLATDTAGASALPILFTWRGGYSSKGGLKLTGGGGAELGGSVVKTLSNSSYATTFSSVSSVTVTHNLGTKDVMVMCYDGSDAMFWPSSIVTTSTTQVTVTFTTNRSGRVVVTR